MADGETVVASVEAYEGLESTSSTKEGELACSRDRLVFTNGGDVTDISLRSVNAVEYEEPSYPHMNLIIGIAGLLIAGAIWSIQYVSDLDEPIHLLGVFIAIFPVIVLLSGLYHMDRHQVVLHIPSKSYEFSTTDDDIKQVVHAIRANEP